jgi:hypothetical protein
LNPPNHPPGYASGVNILGVGRPNGVKFRAAVKWGEWGGHLKCWYRPVITMYSLFK